MLYFRSPLKNVLQHEHETEKEQGFILHSTLLYMVCLFFCQKYLSGVPLIAIAPSQVEPPQKCK